MTLQLDDRQRAMLAEMGVRLFEPAGAGISAATPAPRAPAEAAARPAPPAATAAPTAPAAAPLPAGVPARVLAPLAGPVAAMDWDALSGAVASCQACGLCQGRRQTVFGVGDRQAQWMVIGEAPGEQEDRQGEPFVGPAGQLLNNMLRAIGLARDAQGEGGVYIANTLKCRPPGNRNPEPAEMASCAPYLERQVALVQPRMILAMGRFAVQFLLQTQEPIGRLRGRVHRYQGVPVVVTYHPAYLLRNPADKARAWDDLCLAVQTAREASAQG